MLLRVEGNGVFKTIKVVRASNSDFDIFFAEIWSDVVCITGDLGDSNCHLESIVLGVRCGAYGLTNIRGGEH